MQTMLNSPQFLQQMSSVMSNPAVLDQIIASNPQLAAMGPQVREVFQSDRFRQMMYVRIFPVCYDRSLLLLPISPGQTPKRFA